MSDITQTADKAVEHIANGFQQLADAINKLAPGAWEIAVRQSRNEGYANIILGTFVLAMVLAGVALFFRLSSGWNNDAGDRTGARCVALVVAIFAACLLLGYIRSGILRVATPEFYAAAAIVELAHGK